MVNITNNNFSFFFLIGTVLHTENGCDSWGNPVYDYERIYFLNTEYADCGYVNVGAMDYKGNILWKNNYPNEPFKGFLGQANIALDSSTNTLFWALSNMDLQLNNYLNGLFALDIFNGTEKWYIPIIPKSSITLGNGKKSFIYLFLRSF